MNITSSPFNSRVSFLTTHFLPSSPNSSNFSSGLSVKHHKLELGPILTKSSSSAVILIQLEPITTMVEVFWSLLGAAIPAVVAGQAWRIKRRRDEEDRIKSARGREKNSDDIFVCERVCTSKRMLKKVGAFSKDPIPETCVTVCGVSQLDACSDACARTVCVNQHHVPNWNDVCLRRCQSECLKLSASRSS